MLFLFILDTQRNQLPRTLGTFKIGYFLPKLLESYHSSGLLSSSCVTTCEVASTCLLWGEKSHAFVM